MKNWSLGRIDFNISEQYKLSGRIQNIYYVDVSTTPLTELRSEDALNDKIKNIKSGNNKVTIQIKEIEPDFHAIFYQDSHSDPDIIKLIAQKTVDKTLLEMKFEGKVGKENDMVRGITIIANAYHIGVPYGFNVGAGSIISTPGLNEYSRASFNDQINKIDLNISTQVATTHLNQHPLSEIKDEITDLANDGITLKVISDEERTAAGLIGHEALISLDDGKTDPQFRFTWFTPGATANSFKPEILIKAHGPLTNLNLFKPIWEELLASLKIRNKN